MSWILIIMIGTGSYGDNHAVHSVSFGDQAACENAGQEISKKWVGVKWLCAPYAFDRIKP